MLSSKVLSEMETNGKDSLKSLFHTRNCIQQAYLRDDQMINGEEVLKYEITKQLVYVPYLNLRHHVNPCFFYNFFAHS